jgi:N-acetylneuraminic acid mutarotase
MKKSNPIIKAQILGCVFYLLLLLGICAIPFAPAQRTFDGRTTSATSPKQTQRTLTFVDRVAYQRAIEDVYWRHRIWPKENAKPKPSLDEVMSAAQIEKKVEDYLRDSQALEVYSQRLIAPEQLQVEMERMARNTKQPEVLRDLFEAVGNNPFVIAECVARPVLTEHLVAGLSAYDKSQRFASLRAQAAVSKFSITTLDTATYLLPKISNPDACTDNTWTATSSANAPSVRFRHTAVWTGSEMIVWGGTPDGINALNTGGRYNPSTDSWTATSTTNAPVARFFHTAVWTGSEMIVWGGAPDSLNYLNTGGRYNPSTDSWTATSTTNAPIARKFHTAVWTGSEMIVWGGTNGSPLNTGGRYNPSADAWTATSTTNVPDARDSHTAVWTGNEMIVWGGTDGSPLSTGGRYNPSTNSWTTTSITNAPVARFLHTAVWTGSEMILWGGTPDGINVFNTGGRYNPSTDSWTATSTINVPATRESHAAVWTGSEMIAWGGLGAGIALNTGGRYNPSTDSWTATSTINAPSAREPYAAVWTGREMIVWGGTPDGINALNSGGRYCAEPPPIVPRPTPTPRPRPTSSPRS